MYPRRTIEVKRIVIIQVHLYRMYTVECTVNKVTVSGMLDSYCDLFITWPPSAENIKCLHGIHSDICVSVFSPQTFPPSIFIQYFLLCSPCLLFSAKCTYIFFKFNMFSAAWVEYVSRWIFRSDHLIFFCY